MYSNDSQYAAHIKYGTIKEFDVNCFVCNETFKVSERTNIFPSKDKYYCSRKCANSIGGMVFKILFLAYSTSSSF